MGCAPSTDTGTEYVSLGHHGNRHVSNKTPTDKQLYDNSSNKRRKSSSSSSSSSSSDDQKEKSEYQENNSKPEPPPPVLTDNNRKQSEPQPSIILPPEPQPPPKEKEKKEQQPSPKPPVQEERRQSYPEPIPPPVPPPPREEDKQPTPTPQPPVQDDRRQSSLDPIPTPFPPLPVDEDKQPMPPPPKNDKLTPPPSAERKLRISLVQEQEEIKPIPPPQEEEKQPTPPPPVELRQRQQSMELEDDMIAPPSPLQKERSDMIAPAPPPPPMEDTNNVVPTQTINKPEEHRHTDPPKPKPREKSPEPPDFKGKGYKQTDVGTYESYFDFRSVKKDFVKERRPSPNENGLYTDYNFTVEKAVPHARGLGWKRPHEISDNPVLFCDGTTRFDIGQGQVGTCWFLSMVANIADNEHLLSRVIPISGNTLGTPNYDGIFHCRFWRFGHWSDIYTDDFLPTTPHGTPYGAHSNTEKNEMWVALLEKAFARMYGSYEEVTGGRTADAFMNLTAGVGETIKFKDMKMSPAKLHKRLMNAFQSPTTMVGCVCPDRSDGKYGLVGGHAYSMNLAIKFGDTMLVRLRNPWGKKEWTGRWSDSSREMQSCGFPIEHANQDDGEFYMEMDDFIQFFEQVTICNITPDIDKDGKPDTLNYITCMFGDWRPGRDGGFQKKVQNPKYCFTVGDECADENGNVPLVVQIVQKTEDRQDDKVGIRCDLYKVLSENGNILVLDEIGDKNNMYLMDFSSTYRFRVKPGKYVAIPSTMESGVHKEFLLRTFSAGPLGTPCEVPDHTKVMIGKGPEAEINGKPIVLENDICFSGRFERGKTAGGQISCRTFDQNPQFYFSLDKPTTIKVEVMQPEIENGFPLGIKLFRTDRGKCHVDYEFLANNYRSAIQDTSGNDGPFSYGSSVDCCYCLEPGEYLLLIHANAEDDENDYCLAIYQQDCFKVQEV